MRNREILFSISKALFLGILMFCLLSIIPAQTSALEVSNFDSVTFDDQVQGVQFSASDSSTGLVTGEANEDVNVDIQQEGSVNLESTNDIIAVDLALAESTDADEWEHTYTLGADGEPDEGEAEPTVNLDITGETATEAGEYSGSVTVSATYVE